MNEYAQDIAINRLADEFEAEYAFASPPESWSLEELADLHGYRHAHEWHGVS